MFNLFFRTGVRTVLAAFAVFSFFLGASVSEAQTQFSVNKLIVDIGPKDAPTHDLEVYSVGDEQVYLKTQVFRIVEPGLDSEQRKEFANPVDAGLIATPERLILAPGGARRVLRLIVTQPREQKDRIYRVQLSPQVGEVVEAEGSGVKVMIGYDVLVILRPENPDPQFSIRREGGKMIFDNNGNTNVLIESVARCPGEDDCTTVAGFRLYAGQHAEVPVDPAVPIRVKYSTYGDSGAKMY